MFFVSIYSIVNANGIINDKLIKIREDSIIYQDEISIIKLKKGLNKYKEFRNKDNNIKLEYKNTRENIENGSELDIYIDTENNDYIYLSGTDQIVGFLDNTDIDEFDEIEMKLDEKDALELAKYYLSDKVDLNKFKFDYINYNKEYSMYEVSYYKYLNEYKTSDNVFIWIFADGDIQAFHINDTNKFDDLFIPELNMNKFEEYISTEVYGLEYIIDDMLIDIDVNSNIFVICKIILNLEEGKDMIYVEIPINCVT